MSLRLVDEKVHRLVGTVAAFRFFHFRPELQVFAGTVGGVHLQPAGIHRRQQAETEFGLRLCSKRERNYPGTERLPEKRGHRLSDSRRVDDYPSAAPDIPDNVNKLTVEGRMFFARPCLVFDYPDSRLLL